MSNFPKPHELEELLEFYSEKLDEFGTHFNQNFTHLSVELKSEFDSLKSRIEKYASFSRDNQLEHLSLSETAQAEIETVYYESQKIKSKFDQLEKMFRFKQNLE